MERYIVYDINTLEMIGMIDPEIVSREDHLTRCGTQYSVTTNTITLSSEDEIVYPYMITISDTTATYNPDTLPEPEKQSAWATFAD